jgi:arylsulfatase A-like enzyme/tetratricopeptide (TPR) repeat protein
MRQQWAFGAALLASLALTTGCSSKAPADASGMNLLVITLDTTRADALGLYGNAHGTSPRIDELGRTGIVFEACYTPVPLTLPAHCSLFTGKYPIAHQVRNNGTYVLRRDERTLARLLKDQGYETTAFVSSFTVAAKFGLAQGFDVYDDDFEGGRPILNYTAELPADRVADNFSRWLRARSGRKFFSWVHFFDAHSPYVPHEGAGDNSPWSLYEGEVRFVDTHVGKVIQALRDEKLYENTVIVIVGDHGEAFGEHKEVGHGILCYEESLHVPLILHNPRLFKSPQTVSGRLSLVDIMPGLLELMKISPPDEVQGRSFWPLVDGREKERREVYFESLFGQEEFDWAPLTGLIDGPYKYISLPDTELYNIDADPGETRNLFADCQETAQAIDRKLEALVQRTELATDPKRRALGTVDIKKLTALGYISGFAAKLASMTDPKRGIDLYIEIVGIKDLVAKKDFEAAEKRLVAFQAHHAGLELPDISAARYEILKASGRSAEAAEALRRAIERFPEREYFKIFRAMDLIEDGKMDEARDFCRRIAAENEALTAAHILLGDVEDQLNNLDAALASYEAASAIEPLNGPVRAKTAAVWVKKGDLAKAQAILEGLEGRRAVVNSTDFQEAMSSLGLALLAAGETDRALDLYRKATVLDPESPAVWLNLGSFHFTLGQYDLALADFERSVAVDDTFGLGWSNIGQVHLIRLLEGGSAEEATKALGFFDKAIALEPRQAGAWNGRGSVRMTIGQAAEAIRDYEQALRLDPFLLDAYVNIALALQNEGRYAEALRYLDVGKQRLAAKLGPDDREEIDRLRAAIKALKDGF